MQTEQTVQTVQLFCLLFSNCDLHMIKVYTPFSYSFGNVGTVSNFWTPHEEILRGSFELALSSKTKSRGQVFRAYAD